MKGSAETIEISVQSAPARRFIGIWAAGAEDYFAFWREVAKKGLDCEKVDGLLASLTANMQIGGWQTRKGVRGYLYGVEMESDYTGPIPEGMEAMDIPAGAYAVFRHPRYDYERQDEAVYEALKSALLAWRPEDRDYAWDDSLPTWQRHDPEALGQAWCKPLKAR